MEGKPNNSLEKAENKIVKIISLIEDVLALFIIMMVLLSVKDLCILIHKVYITEAVSSYQIVQGFLSHVLLLVVGLELSMMLLKHTPGNVLEVILYAIARKMLISSDNMYDILLGVVALAIIFLIDKYLHSNDKNKIIG